MKTSPILFAALCLLQACTPDNPDLTRPASNRVLTHTITNDVAGWVINATYFNPQGLRVMDTTYDSNHRPTAFSKTVYNAKGRRVRDERSWPALNPSGYYNAQDWAYLHDTILVTDWFYEKEKLLHYTTHHYDAAGRRTVDSTFHTISPSAIITTKYRYNSQGRLEHVTERQPNGDTILNIHFLNLPLRREESWIQFTFSGSGQVSRQNLKMVTDSSATGKALLYQQYRDNQLVSSTAYTYDAADYLVHIKTTAGTVTTEERYFNGSDGKPDRMELFRNNSLVQVKTYFYQ